jgi:hypothetical protein
LPARNTSLSTGQAYDAAVSERERLRRQATKTAAVTS